MTYVISFNIQNIFKPGSIAPLYRLQTRPRNNYRKLKQEFLKRYKPTTTKKKKNKKGIVSKR